MSRADEKKRVGSETSKTLVLLRFAILCRGRIVLSLKETFVEDDVWVLVSVISKKKVFPSSLLKQSGKQYRGMAL